MALSRILLLAIACSLLSPEARPQFGLFLRKIFVGDTPAPPNHDTAYISTYRQNVTLSAVSSSFQKSVSMAVETWLPSLGAEPAPPPLDPVLTLAVNDPEITRVSLRPERLELG